MLNCNHAHVYTLQPSFYAVLLNVSCPDTVITDYHDQYNFMISINWTSTIDPDDIFTFWFEKICLNHGNITDNHKNEVLIILSHSINLIYVNGRILYLQSSIRSLPISWVLHVDPGTVCLFKGGYSLITPIAGTFLWSVRAESCEIPALQSTGEHYKCMRRRYGWLHVQL